MDAQLRLKLFVLLYDTCGLIRKLVVGGNDEYSTTRKKRNPFETGVPKVMVVPMA